MRPVPLSRLEEVVKPLIQKQIKESNLEDRVTAEVILQRVQAQYAARTAAGFVDDLEDPTCVLFLGTQESWMLDETICQVFRVWIDPDFRDEAGDLVKDIFKTIEAYAEMNSCDSILGASWVYRGALDTEALWLRRGFEIQEKIYVKLKD